MNSVYVCHTLIQVIQINGKYDLAIKKIHLVTYYIASINQGTVTLSFWLVRTCCTCTRNRYYEVNVKEKRCQV